jgi:hypothetical protein
VVARDGMLCDGNADGVSQAETLLRETGVAQVRCVDRDGAAFAPFPLEVQALDIATSPAVTTIIQGQALEVDIALRSVAPLGDGWELVPSPGLIVEHQKRTAAGLHAWIRAAYDAPAHGSVRVLDQTTQRLAGRIEVAIPKRR